MKRIIGFLFLLLSTYIYAKDIHIELSNNQVVPGQTLKTYILSSRPLTQKWIAINKKKIPLYLHPKKKKGKHYWYFAHIGISRKAHPKKQRIYFHLKQKNKAKVIKRYTLYIQKNRFKKQHITLNKTNSKKQSNNKQILKENSSIAKALSKKIWVSKYFFKPFTWPVKGRISSPFGVQRVYNGIPSWSHSGLDIAAKTGTPILSPSYAIVKLTEDMPVHGKTVVLDHGWGIQSIYNHLDSMAVKVGDKVKKSTPIGTVGSTGLSTGPHLHWVLTVHQVKVNPMDWLNNKNLYE